MSDQYFRVNAPRVGTPGVGTPGVGAPGAERQRSALFERLLARADVHTSSTDWRAEAFRLIAPTGTVMPAIAAAALCDARPTDLAEVPAAWVCLATPVHYLAEMTRVRLPVDGIVSLLPAQAEALAADFNRVWRGSGVRLVAARSAQLFCFFDQALGATTHDPREALGQSIEEYLPSGEGSAPLRQLISETEMWLFQQGIRSAPGKSGGLAVNGLWFWGGGAPLAALPATQGWVGGDDEFFNAFGARERAAGGNGVVAVAEFPGGAAWQDIETRWLRPMVGQLRAGESSRLEISVENWRFVLNSRTLRRFWRRTKPWWEFLS